MYKNTYFKIVDPFYFQTGLATALLDGKLPLQSTIGRSRCEQFVKRSSSTFCRNKNFEGRPIGILIAKKMCKLFQTHKLFKIYVKLCKMCQMCNPSPGVGPKICNAGQQRRLMTSESCQRHQRDHHHHDHCHTCQPHHLIHAPRRKDPTGILGSFYVKHVFCVQLLTPLSFSGAKSCIVYCLMGCLPFLFKPPPRLPEEVYEHWTDTSELIHCYWSNSKITDHIYLKRALLEDGNHTL